MIAQKKMLSRGEVLDESRIDEGKNPLEIVPQRKPKKRKLRLPSAVLYVGNLPFVVTFQQIKESLHRNVMAVEWITDRNTKLFYGAAYIHFASLQEACTVVHQSNKEGLLRVFPSYSVKIHTTIT